MRTLELAPTPEEHHDVQKILLRLREMQEQLNELGIINLFPVGSVITKSLRKDNLKIDVILNFSNASLVQDFNLSCALTTAEQEKNFIDMVEYVQALFIQEFSQMNYF